MGTEDPEMKLGRFWTESAEILMAALGVTESGLSEAEASERLARFGPNHIGEAKRHSAARLLIGQFKSPIIPALIAAALLSIFLHDPADSAIILAIVLVSGLLGFWQERGAAKAVEGLLVMILLHKPALEAFLSSLAIAAGRAPQLLPVIIGVNLAHGSSKMAAARVIVCRLSASENFGNMFSMAGASLFLPFPPLLPKQILLTNLLPYTPVAVPLDFEALPPKTILILMGIAVVYLVSAEWGKRLFHRKMGP